MKWFISTKEPKVGDTRSVRKFAFLPTRLQVRGCTSDVMVWLECYTEEQEYRAAPWYARLYPDNTPPLWMCRWAAVERSL